MGTVTAQIPGNPAAEHKGGIAGLVSQPSSPNPLIFTNCYSSSVPIGLNNNNSILNNVISLSLSQMKTKSSYEGFDFDTVWTINPAINDGYPHLKWQSVASSNIYTVALNANGGSVYPTSITVINGGTYNALPIPIKTGFSFDGWYTADSGGTKVNSTDTVNLSGTTTLYAHWRVTPTYTVTLRTCSHSKNMI